MKDLTVINAKTEVCLNVYGFIIFLKKVWDTTVGGSDS